MHFSWCYLNIRIVQNYTWIWCMLALTKLQACLTSSSAFFRWVRCSDCCKSKTQATSILGLPGTVVPPDMSLCVPTLSVLEMPSMMPDCRAAVQDRSYISKKYLHNCYTGKRYHARYEADRNIWFTSRIVHIAANRRHVVCVLHSARHSTGASLVILSRGTLWGPSGLA